MLVLVITQSAIIVRHRCRLDFYGEGLNRNLTKQPRHSQTRKECENETVRRWQKKARRVICLATFEF